MLSDDVFRKELGAAVMALNAWGDAFKDVAAIDVRDAAGYWRMSARPQTAAAAPLTLVLRADQKFDLAIAGEKFEDREIEDFELFVAIARAVSTGNVERLTTRCAVTGRLKASEMVLIFDDGSVWRSERSLGARTVPGVAGGEEVRTQRFLPYRR
ncbi:MAG: hypothetical protein ABL907_06905 [Hyphomicrobium sp.]